MEGVCWITAMRLRVVSGPVTSLNSAIDPGQPWVMISYGTGQFSLFLDSDTIVSVGQTFAKRSRLSPLSGSRRADQQSR